MGLYVIAGNSLECRWHHPHDPEEMTGITEGQGERTGIIMMATEEAEGTVPTSSSPKL